MDETLANTQEIIAADIEDNNVDVWGRILPIVDKYPCVELTNPVYTIGRSGDISLSPLCPFFNSISKVHFEIRHEKNLVLLRDRSQNGTFVNGERMRKDKAIILNTNDEIALSCKMNRAFIFIDMKSKEQLYPDEVTSKYTISKRIGSGACGEVRLAFNNDTYEKIAVKIIEKKIFPAASSAATTTAGGGKSTSIEREVKILRQLNHPCVIQFQDAIETEEMLYIFMELVEGGELFDRVISVKQFSESEAQVLFYQMVLAIKYLHDNNVSHRDLKPENILLVSADSNHTLIKVTDFGLSKFVDGKTMLKTLCGTPNYLSPEVILGRGETGYTFACDVWSLGVILFICIGGYPPFTDERSDYSLREQIVSGKFDFPAAHWADVSASAIDLISRMLEVDPAQRISVDEIMEHAWLADNQMRASVRQLMHPLADVNARCDGDAVGCTSNTGGPKQLDETLEVAAHVKRTREPVAKRRKLQKPINPFD